MQLVFFYTKADLKTDVSYMKHDAHVMSTGKTEHVQTTRKRTSLLNENQLASTSRQTPTSILAPNPAPISVPFVVSLFTLLLIEILDLLPRLFRNFQRVGYFPLATVDSSEKKDRPG